MIKFKFTCSLIENTGRALNAHIISNAEHKLPDAAMFYAKPSENTNITRVAADDIRHSSKFLSSVRTCFGASLGALQNNLKREEYHFFSLTAIERYKWN